MAYRVERSLELLRHTDLDVTGIAETADLPIPAIMPRVFVERWMYPPPVQKKPEGKLTNWLFLPIISFDTNLKTYKRDTYRHKAL